MIITIDGPAGSGKSTLAKAVAHELGFMHLDTGAMYRCVSLYCLQHAIDASDEQAVNDALNSIAIVFSRSDKGVKVLLNDQDVSDAIRTPEVDNVVSAFAALPQVRQFLVAQQRSIVTTNNFVAEGRDMGTVVFPQAEVKIYLTASFEERAKRRAKDRDDQSESSVKSIADNLKKRDEIDTTRKVTPLKPAEDAHMLDTTNMTLEQEVTFVKKLIDRANHTSQTKQEPKKQAKVQEKDRHFDMPVSSYSFFDRFFVSVAFHAVNIFVKLYFPYTFTHKEEVLEHNVGTGNLLIMNHISSLDPIVPLLEAHKKKIVIRPIYKSEFNKSRFLKALFKRLGGIPVNRNTADMKALRRAKAALERGEHVLIFPEGTRVKPGQDAKVHGGFTLIADMAKADIMPMAIIGAEQVIPEGKKLPKRSHLYVTAGKKIPFANYQDLKRKQRSRALETDAMGEVYALVDELRQLHSKDNK